MRVLVCGDRKWTDSELIRIELLNIWKDHREGLIIIEGECQGADLMAAAAAKKEGFNLERYPANWERFGLAAGPKRNLRMLKDGKPDLVLAFHDDLKNSKGTKHMISIAKKAGVPVKVITHGDRR